jgi:hypothetical protein
MGGDGPRASFTSTLRRYGMPIYYVTYSATIDGGHITGRSQITSEKPMTSMRRIEQVETSILENVLLNTPSARNLYLTFWREIESDTA